MASERREDVSPPCELQLAADDMLGGPKHFILANWAGPVDLEPTANATCMVIMFAGQGYDVLPVSES